MAFIHHKAQGDCSADAVKGAQQSCILDAVLIAKKKAPRSEGFSEATIGFEPMIRVLQTRALPLGHVAIQEVICLIKKRAGSETRTRDLLLGKEVFYQLNYTRTRSFC